MTRWRGTVPAAISWGILSIFGAMTVEKNAPIPIMKSHGPVPLAVRLTSTVSIVSVLLSVRSVIQGLSSFRASVWLKHHQAMLI